MKTARCDIFGAQSVTFSERDSSRARYGICHDVTAEIVTSVTFGVTCRVGLTASRHITPCGAQRRATA